MWRLVSCLPFLHPLQPPYSPARVQDVPEAVPYLVNPTNVSHNAPELRHLAGWSLVTPERAVSFFAAAYKAHPIVTRYAIRVLRAHPPDVIIFFVPQLVQALRYETNGFLYEYLRRSARISPVIAHQLIWNMRTYSHTDEERPGEYLFPFLGPLVEDLTADIVRDMSDEDTAFYEAEFAFFGQVCVFFFLCFGFVVVVVVVVVLR